MGKFFSYDGGLIRILNKLVDCVFLSVLFLLFSLPIITFGASSTALYYTANKVIRRDRSHVWREFWGAFKANFKQSTIVWLILMVLYWILVANCLLMRQWSQTALLVFYAIFIVLITVWALYMFPHIARFENKITAMMKNCAFMSIRHLVNSLVLLVLFALAIVVLLMWPILILVIPALHAVLQTLIFEPLFRKYMSDEDLEAEDERNCDYYN